MRYTIITLNDDRKAFKDKIRDNVACHEILLPPFNAYEEDPMEGIEKRGLRLDPIWPNAKKGELGVWLSNYDRWMNASLYGDLLVFEDDAIVDETFGDKYTAFMQELPDDWDFAALWVPENQRIDYLYDVTYTNGLPHVKGMKHPSESLFNFEGSERAAFVYQGYGMVSLVYSQKGGRKLVELAQDYGITGPVDCWIYEHAHMDNLKGYAPRPDYADIVAYDWSAVSHVQLTEKAL